MVLGRAQGRQPGTVVDGDRGEGRAGWRLAGDRLLGRITVSDPDERPRASYVPLNRLEIFFEWAGAVSADTLLFRLVQGLAAAIS
jgi:hypothetical protein